MLGAELIVLGATGGLADHFDQIRAEEVQVSYIHLDGLQEQKGLHVASCLYEGQIFLLLVLGEVF